MATIVLSAGDVIQGVRLVWNVYQTLSDGPKNAKEEYRQFRTEVENIRSHLEKLQELEASTEHLTDGLGPSYQQTLKECHEFLQKHEKLVKGVAKDSNASRVRNVTSRFSVLMDQLTWPRERGEAHRLREALRQHVQVATLAQTNNIARQIAQTSEQARLERLEILRASKILISNVSFLLRRCISNGATRDNAVDYHFVRQLEQRDLPELLEYNPWHDTLCRIPENGELPCLGDCGHEEASLDQLLQLSEKVDYLRMRRNTASTVDSLGSAQIRPSGRVNTTPATSSTDTSITPIMTLLSDARNTVRQALGTVGFERVALLESTYSRGEDMSDDPKQALIHAVAEWDQISNWVKFQLTHTGKIPPRFSDINWNPATPGGSTNRLSCTEPPRSHLPSHPASSSRPSSQPETSSRRRSSDRKDSMPLIDLGPSITPAQKPVTVAFPSPPFSRPPVECDIKVYFSRHIDEVRAIEASALDGSVKITHTINSPSSFDTESSMIPWLDNGHVTTTPFRFSFLGSHKIKIEENGQVTRHVASPIYICDDKTDFESFQTTLLKRDIKFCADVRHITSDWTQSHCSLETVRILEDTHTKCRFILYFAEKRIIPLAGFMEWPVEVIAEAKNSGNDVTLKLRRNTKRRNSSESSTSFSHESHGLSPKQEAMQQMRSLEFKFFEQSDAKDFWQIIQDSPF